jgi:hypothetical protein
MSDKADKRPRVDPSKAHILQIDQFLLRQSLVPNAAISVREHVHQRKPLR